MIKIPKKNILIAAIIFAFSPLLFTSDATATLVLFLLIVVPILSIKGDKITIGKVVTKEDMRNSYEVLATSVQQRREIEEAAKSAGASLFEVSGLRIRFKATDKQYRYLKEKFTH